MLARQGILSEDECDAIVAGLSASASASPPALRVVGALEDVHMNIEAALTADIGDAGKRLHTGRSRNDQVATDIRLWLRDEIDAIGAGIDGCSGPAGPRRARGRDHHARLHAPAGRPAHHLRPSHDGLGRDARP
jgi:hypothetical protein